MTEPDVRTATSTDDAPTSEPTSLEARLLDIVQQAVIATDIEGKVVFWNAYAQRLYGWTAAEAIGRSIVDLTPSETSRDDALAIMERLTRGESWAGEFAVRRKDGSRFVAFVVDSPVLDDDGLLAGIVGISTDVSELRALERQMQQAAKMEAIGRLAGGVAHDFNNLLTVILGHADLTLRNPVTDPASVRTSVEAIHTAAARAAELTQQLLAFSRQQLVSPTVLAVDGALERLMPMLRRLIEADIRIDVVTPSETVYTVIDPSQFDQVVMNLVVNARDAMADGGVLRLALEPVAFPDRDAPVVGDGAYVRLTVSDSGEGMPPDVLARVFEPFFTTKPSARGTGLGLATVFGIIDRAGGVVQVDSVVGEGTTFWVMLPRAGPPAVEPGPTDPAPMGGERVAGRTILLVEDDAALRNLTARILRAAGYDVLVADDASEALVIADTNSERIDVLLSDIVMPGGSGVDLARELRRRRPGMPILLMTGYARDELFGTGRPDPGFRVLQKPFVAAELLAAVHDVVAP